MANKKQKCTVDIGEESVREIADGLKKHKEVYVRKLGKFRVKEVKARDGYIPTVGHVSLPKAKRVVFAINKGLKRGL